VARPNPAWVGFVRTGKARAEVRHFLRTTKRQESVELGARLFAQAAAQLSLAPQDVTAERWRRWRARPMHAIATSCWPTSDSAGAWRPWWRAR